MTLRPNPSLALQASMVLAFIGSLDLRPVDEVSAQYSGIVDFLEPFGVLRELPRVSDAHRVGWGAPEETMETGLTDEELLGRAARGDELSFTRLYRRRQGTVYRFVLQLTGSRVLAEEVTQEVFLIMIQKASDFDPSRGALGSYLYGVARNLVLRHWREERQRDDVDWQGKTPSSAVPMRPDPLAELERSKIVLSVRRAVLALPQPYREVVVLCDLQELTYAEAASVLDCRVGTIRSRLHRGRALLIDRIADGVGVTDTGPAEELPPGIGIGDEGREDISTVVPSD